MIDRKNNNLYSIVKLCTLIMFENYKTILKMKIVNSRQSDRGNIR